MVVEGSRWASIRSRQPVACLKNSATIAGGRGIGRRTAGRSVPDRRRSQAGRRRCRSVRRRDTPETDFLHDPDYNLARLRFSPDGRWISFVAVNSAGTHLVVAPFRSRFAAAPQTNGSRSLTMHRYPRTKFAGLPMAISSTTRLTSMAFAVSGPSAWIQQPSVPWASQSPSIIRTAPAAR